MQSTPPPRRKSRSNSFRDRRRKKVKWKKNLLKYIPDYALKIVPPPRMKMATPVKSALLKKNSKNDTNQNAENNPWKKLNSFKIQAWDPKKKKGSQARQVQFKNEKLNGVIQNSQEKEAQGYLVKTGFIASNYGKKKKKKSFFKTQRGISLKSMSSNLNKLSRTVEESISQINAISPRASKLKDIHLLKHANWAKRRKKLNKSLPQNLKRNSIRLSKKGGKRPPFNGSSFSIKKNPRNISPGMSFRSRRRNRSLSDSAHRAKRKEDPLSSKKRNVFRRDSGKRNSLIRRKKNASMSITRNMEKDSSQNSNRNINQR